MSKMQEFKRLSSKTRASSKLLIYTDDESSETVRSTPPTVQDRLLAMPGAPTKFRKEFDKKILRPKKLVYNDKENGDSSLEIDLGYTNTRSSTEDEHDTWMGMKMTKNTSDSRNERATRSKKIDGNKKKKGAKKIERTNTEEKLAGLNKENDENLGRDNEEVRGYSSQQEKRRDGVTKKPLARTNQPSTTTKPDSKEQSKKSERATGNKLIVLDRNYFADQYEIGLWIQCSNKKCAKWRYVQDIHDPVAVRGDWFCDMNPDQEFNDCSIAEVPVIQDELIEIEYNAGSIVMAKAGSDGWWPGIIDECPEFGVYWAADESGVASSYHVTFIEGRVFSRCWLKSASIKAFEELDQLKISERKRKSVNFKKSTGIAKAALSLPIRSRLLKHSSLTRKTVIGVEAKKRKPRSVNAQTKKIRENLKKGPMLKDKDVQSLGEQQTNKRQATRKRGLNMSVASVDKTSSNNVDPCTRIFSSHSAKFLKQDNEFGKRHSTSDVAENNKCNNVKELKNPESRLPVFEKRSDQVTELTSSLSFYTTNDSSESENSSCIDMFDSPPLSKQERQLKHATDSINSYLRLSQQLLDHTTSNHPVKLSGSTVTMIDKEFETLSWANRLFERSLESCMSRLTSLRSNLQHS